MYVVCTLGVRKRGRSCEDGRNWLDRFVDFSGVGVVGLRREECRQGVISRQLTVRWVYDVCTLYIRLMEGATGDDWTALQSQPTQTHIPRGRGPRANGIRTALQSGVVVWGDQVVHFSVEIYTRSPGSSR